MAKTLQDLIQKSLKEDLSAVAKDPKTVAPKTKAFASVKGLDRKSQEMLEVAYIAKKLNGGKLSEKDAASFNAELKAVGVTSDITELLPDGFTGTLLKDVEAELNVGKLFPMGKINGGTAHDLISLYGISAYLVDEAATGTDSAEGYMTFVKTTKKLMTIVRKSYEAMDDSLIDLAQEIRYGLVRSIAEAVEFAIISGDVAATHMDANVTAANDARKTFNGIRKHALGKGTVDFTGVDLTEEEMYKKIIEMQLAGGLYLDDAQVSKGNVVLVVDNYLYSKFRLYDSFRTIDKAGRLATLFGGKVDSVFGIPVISSSNFPAVDASGVVDATPANNTFSSCVMMNVDTFKLYSNGTMNSDSDKDITNETYVWTASLRCGFSSQFDSTESAPNTIDANFKNAIAGINIAR
jgi:HK97 family phage major capsid protein